MAEEKSPAEVRKMRKSLNQRFSHVKCNLTLRFVSQAPQSRFYRRTELIQFAIPPALKCLRNGG